jgi:hypothetical protein
MRIVAVVLLLAAHLLAGAKFTTKWDYAPINKLFIAGYTNENTRNMFPDNFPLNGTNKILAGFPSKITVDPNYVAPPIRRVTKRRLPRQPPLYERDIRAYLLMMADVSFDIRQQHSNL